MALLDFTYHRRRTIQKRVASFFFSVMYRKDLYLIVVLGLCQALATWTYSRYLPLHPLFEIILGHRTAAALMAWIAFPFARREIGSATAVFIGNLMYNLEYRHKSAWLTSHSVAALLMRYVPWAVFWAAVNLWRRRVFHPSLYMPSNHKKKKKEKQRRRKGRAGPTAQEKVCMCGTFDPKD